MKQMLIANHETDKRGNRDGYVDAMLEQMCIRDRAGRAAAAQHSQNLTAAVAHFPGAKIVIASDAYTAKGLLKSAIRDNNPVIVIEHRKHYSMQFDLPDDADENLLLPLDRAAVVHEGLSLIHI